MTSAHRSVERQRNHSGIDPQILSGGSRLRDRPPQIHNWHDDLDRHDLRSRTPRSFVIAVSDATQNAVVNFELREPVYKNFLHRDWLDDFQAVHCCSFPGHMSVGNKNTTNVCCNQKTLPCEHSRTIGAGYRFRVAKLPKVPARNVWNPTLNWSAAPHWNSSRSADATPLSATATQVAA